VKEFEGRIAVVTGGGTGMGRELARQLSAAGCHVAICDVSPEAMAHTEELCAEQAPQGTQISTFVADVSEEGQVTAFRDHAAEVHATDHVHLLFNNAGVGGGGSLFQDSREEWDKTFAVCWNGVYFTTRAFLPMLVASPQAHLINTSSVNGFWASIGPDTPHTAYSAAKFAVKGFSEALITDLRVNAPHVRVSVVMPGHIGTAIAQNTLRLHGRDPKELSDEELAAERERMAGWGFPAELSNQEFRQALQQWTEDFRDKAPMTAAEAAAVILDGVRGERWRILVGEDAAALDRLVRGAPEEAYERSFMDRLKAEAGWALGE